MLFRRKNVSPRYPFAIGQLSLAAGILLTRFGTRIPLPMPEGVVASEAAAGFFTALGGTLLGISLVLNLSALRDMRCKSTDSEVSQ